MGIFTPTPFPIPKITGSGVFLPVLPRPMLTIVRKKRERDIRRRKFRGTPSLSVVLGGMGTRLTRQQIAGKETISPLLIRQIGKQQRIRRIV